MADHVPTDRKDPVSGVSFHSERLVCGGFGCFANPLTGKCLRLSEDAIECSHSDSIREYTLTRDVLYVDPRMRCHLIPAGFKGNGLTVWRILWWACPPDDPHAFAASVLHDWLYVMQYTTRREADKVFYCAMRSRGCPAWKACRNWLVVRLLGWWRWNQEKKKRLP